MLIPVDSYSEELLDEAIPEDVHHISSEYASLGTGEQVSHEAPTADVPGNPVLDRWDVKTHTYKDEVAGKVGFLAGLFLGTAESVAAGVVHEAKRYRLETTSKGRVVEIGISVRLSVATTTFNAKFDLSIPNLAAQAQLGMSEARIGISVVGFSGPVGDLLPAPQDLNVENFSVFTNAAKLIQKRIFGPDGVEFLVPTLLSFEENAEG